MVASARNGGKAVKRPWLGARLQAVTPEIAETIGLKVPSGALVANVSPNSPAARAGLKLSDLIVSIDGQPVEDPNAFDYHFATRPLGGTAEVDVQRNGRVVKLAVPLETAPDTGRDEIVITARSPFQGAKVANISPALADELHLDSSIEGVVVTDLANDATAASVGFQKGDIILSVNDTKIAKTADLERAAAASKRRWYVTFAEVSDRTAAEGLTGVTLVVDAEDSEDEDDAWYPHELAGLRAEHVDGRLLGEVVGLEHAPAHDVLVIRETDGARTLVPFVRAIVPVVDVAGGRVVLDPPGGLLASDAANLVVSDETRGGDGARRDADDEA